MKEKVYKAVLVCAYLLLMMAVLKFQISLIIDLPKMLYLLIGTGILTMIYVTKEKNRNQMIVVIRLNLMVTGVLISFLSLVSIFANRGASDIMNSRVVTSFLPVFYAMLFILLLDLFSRGTSEGEQMMADVRADIEGLNLTRREQMVAQLLFVQLTYKEIGEKLFITENTVKKHVHNIYEKAHVKNRTELVHVYKFNQGGEADDKE